MNTDDLIPIAAELIGTVRDYGPDAVADVLARVPEGRHDALAVILAAMVDPDKTPAQLLAWMDEPVVSREYTPATFRVKRFRSRASEHAETDRERVERLRTNGLTVRETAERLGITARTVERHRAVTKARVRDAGSKVAGTHGTAVA